MIMEREGGGTKYSTMCYNTFSSGTVAEHRLQLAPTKKSSEQITSSISGMWLPCYCAFRSGSNGDENSNVYSFSLACRTRGLAGKREAGSENQTTVYVPPPPWNDWITKQVNLLVQKKCFKQQWLPQNEPQLCITNTTSHFPSRNSSSTGSRQSLQPQYQTR